MKRVSCRKKGKKTGTGRYKTAESQNLLFDISVIIDTMKNTMENIDTLTVLKALCNETRLNILFWLRDPRTHFPDHGLHLPEAERFIHGVCVGAICEKAGISQSTGSHYLEMMRKAGLLKLERTSKWTYYRRDEAAIQAFADHLRLKL